MSVCESVCQYVPVHVSTCHHMSARVSVSKYVLLRVSTFQYLFICSFINLKMHFYNNKIGQVEENGEKASALQMKT